MVHGALLPALAGLRDQELPAPTGDDLAGDLESEIVAVQSIFGEDHVSLKGGLLRQLSVNLFRTTGRGCNSATTGEGARR